MSEQPIELSLCHYGNISDDTYDEQVNKYCHGWWPKSYLLSSATCDEILSWMIEIWMKNHLISESNWNTINLYSPQKN